MAEVVRSEGLFGIVLDSPILAFAITFMVTPMVTRCYPVTRWQNLAQS